MRYSVFTDTGLMIADISRKMFMEAYDSGRIKISDRQLKDNLGELFEVKIGFYVECGFSNRILCHKGFYIGAYED